MTGYLNVGGAALEPDKIFVGDTLKTELFSFDVGMKAQDKDITAVFGVGVGGSVIAAPMVRKGVLYFGACDKKFYAADAKTGRQRWVFEGAKDIIFQATMAEDRFYFTSYDRGLYALDSDGQLRWVFYAPDKLACKPAVDEEKVYVTCKDGQLYAVDKETGELVWTFTEGTPSWGSPCVHEGTVYVGFSSGKCCALTCGGELKWMFIAGGPVASVACNKDIVVFPAYDGKVYALDRKGRLLWTFVTKTRPVNWTPPLVDNGMVYVGSYDPAMYALSLEGKLIWKQETDSIIEMAPVIVNQNAYVTTFDGNLYCLDKGSGELHWKRNMGGKTFTATTDGEKLFFSCWDCKVICTNLEGEAQWTFPTSISYIAPVNFEQTRPEVVVISSLPSQQTTETEKEQYKNKTGVSVIGGESVYSGLNIGYASSGQYTSRSKYAK